MPTYRINESTHRELEKYKEYMREQEYTVATTTGYNTYLSRFLRQVGLPHASTLEEAIEAFLENERTSHQQTFKYCCAALRQYFKMTTGGNLSRNPETKPAPRNCRLASAIRNRPIISRLAG